jgi:hypothetical protein
MSGILKVMFWGMTICAAGLLAASAQENKAEKHDIKGGIEGKVSKVDVDNKTLTMITAEGRERTFTITDETVILGPRGGKVRHHLKDPRFREGFPVTVVAERNIATEVHLGSARDALSERGAEKTKYGSKTPDKSQDATPSQTAKDVRPTPRAATPGRNFAQSRLAKKAEDENDEGEIPGTIKSFDPSRRVLVIILLNGTEKSFLLAKDVPVHVKGAISKEGLHDPALKVGAHIEVVTDEGGRKVKELKIIGGRLRRAG